MSMEYLEQYFRYCALQKKLDAKTLKAYRIDLEQLAAYLQANGLSTNRAALEQYVEQLSARCKPAKVKRKYASIRAYVHYLVYEELLDRSPVEKVRLQLRQEVVLPRLIEKDALTGILDAAYEALEASAGEHQRFFCLRDAAVLELLFACGARVSELCHLRASTLDLERQVVRIMGKGGRERWVYLCSPQVLDVLGRYRSACQARYPGAVWFFVNRDGKRLSEQSVRRIIARCASAAQIGGRYTPHMFRHSFATYLWDNCGDIYEVKNILGHSSIKTTERYVHASLQRQKMVLTTAHPRQYLTVHTVSSSGPTLAALPKPPVFDIAPNKE